MDGAVNLIAAVLGLLATLAFWAMVIFVLPTVFVLYAAALFPLTGQWRERWRSRRRKVPPA
jgi:hypothetical protein